MFIVLRRFLLVDACICSAVLCHYVRRTDPCDGAVVFSCLALTPVLVQATHCRVHVRATRSSMVTPSSHHNTLDYLQLKVRLQCVQVPAQSPSRLPWHGALARPRAAAAPGPRIAHVRRAPSSAEHAATVQATRGEVAAEDRTGDTELLRRTELAAPCMVRRVCCRRRIFG